MVKVSVSRVYEYETDKIRSAVIRSLSNIDFALPRNKSVLVKPNCFAQNAPEKHSVTHFSVIGALLSLLRDNGCAVVIGESSAFFQKGLTRKAFAVTRISEVAMRYGARLVPFEEEPLLPVELSGYMNVSDFPISRVYVPEAVLKSELLINAPKLKSHGNGFRLSGAVKNLFGLFPGGYKQIIHLRLKHDMDACRLMAALHKIAPCGLNVMDAVVGLDGGPSAMGRPVRIGAVLASTNAAALDSVASRIIGYAPDEVPILSAAFAEGLLSSPDEVVTTGDEPPLARFRRLSRGEFPGPRKKDSAFIKDTYVFPVVRERKCTDCLKCADFCPALAISRTGSRKYGVDYSECIYCYYCFSACPENAIEFRSSIKNKAIRFMRKVLRI